MRAVALFLAVLLAVSALAFFATAPPARAATTYISGQLIESAGPTSAFGGGNYRFIEFGTDAAFGIVWGNATHANSIYVVAIKARYLGVGQVYYASNGTLIKANQPVKVYTIYAAQLQDIVEYRDVTNDGVANYTRTYNANPALVNYTFTQDVGYKLVNLTANWVPGNVTRTNGTAYRTWTFNLTATNLAYYNITGRKAKLTGSLPIVQFTFHLNASLVQTENVTVPQWNVSVGRIGGHYVLTNVARISDLTLQSVKTVHYAVKWDQLIEGWTYDHRNNAPPQRRLLLETGTIVANYVPPEVIAGWAMIHQLGDDGQAHYNTTAGAQTVDNSSGAYSSPRVFKSPNLDFGGTWTRIARFEWTTNSTVDGAAANLTAQVVGGFGFAYLDSRGLWYGFVLLTGLNYLGGNQIVHDPTVTSDVMTDLTFQSPVPPGGILGPGVYGLIVVGVIVLVVLLLVVYAVIVRGRKKQEPPTPPAQPPSP